MSTHGVNTGLGHVGGADKEDSSKARRVEESPPEERA